jgi:predicted trehalose synthase
MIARRTVNYRSSFVIQARMCHGVCKTITNGSNPKVPLRRLIGRMLAVRAM